MMENSCPVVIVHRGNQRYFKDVVHFARKHGNTVYVIGDESNRNIGNWEDYKNLNTELCDKFCSVYKHMSTNPYSYELICFQRYYWMYEFMIKHGFESIFHLDSDMLLFKKLDESLFSEKCDAACSYCTRSMGIEGVASIHFSYWKKDALYDFLTFLIDTYENRLDVLETQHEKEKGNEGGICDMRLLAYWISETSKKVISLEEFYGTYIYDQNINNEYNYEEKMEMESVFNVRKIYLQNGELFYKSLSGKEYRVGASHFQGGAKMFIHCYSKGQRSFLAKFIAYIEYWINRVYEKILRTFGHEKRYAWK